MEMTSRLEQQLSTSTRERIFEMLRTREVYQYGVTDKVKVAELVSIYVSVPADIILGYMFANAAVAARSFEKAYDEFTHDYHGNPISLPEFLAKLC